jgi:hypothetical protein
LGRRGLENNAIEYASDSDGDGKADIAVCHSASGLWFIKPSLSGADYYVSYGGAGYVPINLDYLLGWVY